jgi:hypothetical protein
LDKLPQRS